MKFIFLNLAFLVFTVNVAFGSNVHKKSQQYLEGYFQKKDGELFFSEDPGRISPSIRVKISKKHNQGICIGGLKVCSKTGVLGKFEIEKKLSYFNIHAILPSRKIANEELKILNKLWAH